MKTVDLWIGWPYGGRKPVTGLHGSLGCVIISEGCNNIISMFKPSMVEVRMDHLTTLIFSKEVSMNKKTNHVKAYSEHLQVNVHTHVGVRGCSA